MTTHSQSTHAHTQHTRATHRTQSIHTYHITHTTSRQVRHVPGSRFPAPPACPPVYPPAHRNTADTKQKSSTDAVLPHCTTQPTRTNPLEDRCLVQQLAPQRCHGLSSQHSALALDSNPHVSTARRGGASKELRLSQLGLPIWPEHAVRRAAHWVLGCTDARSKRSRREVILSCSTARGRLHGTSGSGDTQHSAHHLLFDGRQIKLQVSKGLRRDLKKYIAATRPTDRVTPDE